MITTHFKQAWQLLRQNRLFSTIYIIGTALAIASTTIFAIIYYVKLAPVYPEYKRHQIYTVSNVEVEDTDGMRMGAPSFSYNLLDNLFYKLDNAEAVSGYIVEPGLKVLTVPGSEKIYEVMKRCSDPEYFKIIDYEFLAGRPFSQAEFESGAHKLVVSDRTAEKIFGSAEAAVGKTVSVDFSDYEICGVFRDGSALNSMSYTHVIAPYTVRSGYDSSYNECTGWYQALILTDDPDGVNAEIDEYCRRYKTAHDGRGLYFPRQPRSAVSRAFNPVNRDDFDLMSVVRLNFLILLTLLIVPALNLSGMIAGRMDARNEELSVRKSFGATSRRLLSQVLWENMFLTLAGGIIGLGLTYLTLYAASDFIVASIGAAGQMPMNSMVEMRLTPDMMFAPAVFAGALLICVVLNLMSALIPAWHALRQPIVKSMK